MLVDRITYILEQCAGKRVLHLGCTDWPYTEAKLAGDALLHKKISSVSALLTGMDADIEGVNYFHRIGFDKTFVDDAEQFTNPELFKQDYDVIIAGEIIEHLENPGLFLRNVQKLMNPTTDLIVTTINAYCFHRFVYYLRGKEMVHEDHNYYFSPKVLRKLLTRCGLSVIDFKQYAIGAEIRALNPRRIVWLDDVSKFFFPSASDGIIFKVRRER